LNLLSNQARAAHIAGLTENLRTTDFQLGLLELILPDLKTTMSIFNRLFGLARKHAISVVGVSDATKVPELFA